MWDGPDDRVFSQTQAHCESRQLREEFGAPGYVGVRAVQGFWPVRAVRHRPLFEPYTAKRVFKEEFREDRRNFVGTVRNRRPGGSGGAQPPFYADVTMDALLRDATGHLDRPTGHSRVKAFAVGTPAVLAGVLVIVWTSVSAERKRQRDG